MGKQLRLGNCSECGGFVMVDVAEGTVAPLFDTCRHCGVELDGGSILNVPLLEADRGDVSSVTCDNCGERWTAADVATVGDELGRCPSCDPTVDGPESADS